MALSDPATLLQRRILLLLRACDPKEVTNAYHDTLNGP